MNPDILLSNERVYEICLRHSITYQSHERITTGFSHEVHRLNDDLLIKLFNPGAVGSFETERALLASNLDFPKPALVASYEASEESDRSYIIMSFVPGMPLGANWHRATNEQRESLIAEISKALKAINRLDPTAVKKPYEDWRATIEGKILKLANKLYMKQILTEQQKRKVLDTTTANAKYLENGTLYPVFWDIHFDNFIVNEEFELQAVIDLENVELCALDFPLFVVEKLMREPHKYLSEENEKYANIDDYMFLKSWYEKYYPEMFDVDHLNERVRLYLLLDTLHLLVDWPHVKDLYVWIDELTRS